MIGVIIIAGSELLLCNAVLFHNMAVISRQNLISVASNGINLTLLNNGFNNMYINQNIRHSFIANHRIWYLPEHFLRKDKV